jgi:CRISPR-associated protein Cas1
MESFILKENNRIIMQLVLNSFGASLKKENGLFLVQTTDLKQIIHPRDLKSIVLSQGARISSDAVLLAIENEIDVLFVDKAGKHQGRIWSSKYGSVSEIRKKQLEFLYGNKVVDWVKDKIVEKINNQIAFMTSLQISMEETNPNHRAIAYGINAMEDYKRKIRKEEAEIITDIAASLRGWEGAASKKYFNLLATLVPESFRFEKRSTHPAMDKFNSLLNYAYGILYGKVEGSLIRAGIDPYVGIFHRDDYNRPALVFDIIEKYRIWADYVVYHLCAQEAFSEECFRFDPQGACYVEGLGKRIIIQSMNDYLAEVVILKGLPRSRGEHIQQDAYELANYFLESFFNK